jgi:hypothetical protein
MVETLFNFPELKNVEVHIHPETIKEIETTDGMGHNIKNWNEQFGPHLTPDSEIIKGKARFIYTVEIDTGV